MTANLWGKRVDRDGLAALLAEVDPDVLALQELGGSAAPVITAAFEHHLLGPYARRLGGGIATRLPATFRRLAFQPRGGWSARLDPGDWPGLGRSFEVVDVHFANPVGWPIWRELAARRRQLRALVDHLAGSDLDRAVAGDFNASPMWPVYRRMRMLMTDAAAATGSLRRTWRPYGLGPPLLRIDHVFVSGVQPLRTETVNIPGSDHLAVVADLEIG